MGKRVAIILLSLLVSGLAILGYFIQRGKNNLFTDPFKAISRSACIVIETVDLQSFMNSLTTGKGIFGEVGKIKELDLFNRKLQYIANVLNKPELKKLLTTGSAIISFHPQDGGKLMTLLAMTVPEGIRYRHIKEALRLSGINDLIDKKKGSYAILKVPFSAGSRIDTVFISYDSGLLLCSDSEKLVEEARLQMNSGNDVRNLPGFSRVLLASGKREDKIFVNFANLQHILRNILGTKGDDLAEKIAIVAGTAEGDIYISEDGFVLSGFTESLDSSDILFRYKFIPAKELHTYKILPSSTVLFETIVSPVHVPEKKFITTVSQKAVDLYAKIKGYTGEEITRAYLDIKGSPVYDNTLIIYELNNSIQAEQIFLDVLGRGNEILYFQPDEQTKIPVYKTPFKGFSTLLFNGFAPDFDDSYFAFYDNFKIISSKMLRNDSLLFSKFLEFN